MLNRSRSNSDWENGEYKSRKPRINCGNSGKRGLTVDANTDILLTNRDMSAFCCILLVVRIEQAILTTAEEIK